MHKDSTTVYTVAHALVCQEEASEQENRKKQQKPKQQKIHKRNK
jgi:hypothetical protein